MRKPFVVAVLCIIASLLLITQANAYTLTFWYVQHRVYEDGRDVNRLSFSFQDASGNYPTSNVLQSAKLLDPKGQEVSISKISFYYDTSWIGADYNTNTGQFIYKQEPDSGYTAEIYGSLQAGTYTLNVEDVNGAQLSATFQFTGYVNLSIVPASSINSYKDGNKNLIITWDAPTGWEAYQTNTVGFLDVYKDGVYVGEIWVRVPTYLGYVSIPNSLVQQIKTWGNQFKFTVIFRTKVNDNRTHSNYVEVDPDSGQLKWKNAVHLGGGWEWLDWFGSFNPTYYPWIYHQEHSWLYAFGNDNSLVIWDPQMSVFWWTSNQVYPFLYRFSDGVWLWYQKRSSNPRWFYNYKTSQWESH